MKSIKNKRPVVVGIFILLGIVILIIAVFTLGGQKKTFVKTFTINAIFNDVNGLQPGNNVWFSGVKIGTIKKLSFYGTSQVLVEMHLEVTSQSHIRKDAHAKISSDGLIGNKIVVIYGGATTTPQVKSGDYLTVEKALSTEDMLVTLQANNKNLLDITNNFKLISKSLVDGNGTIGTLLNDSSLALSLRTTVIRLRSMVTNFEAASAKSENVIANLEHFSSGLNDKGTLANELITDTTIFNSLKNTVNELHNAATTATQFTDNLKTASEGLNKKNNAVGVLLNDEDVAASLKNTVKNLESSSKKLDEDLEALQHNFLLRGFFRNRNK
ncbi:MAG: MlaD family protein [Chitinophagaceae bacterium]